MSQPDPVRTLWRYAVAAALICLTVGQAKARGQDAQQTAPTAPTSVSGEAMVHSPGHMYMTTLRPMQPADQQRADAVVAAAKVAMAPYRDYRKALADGYRIFLPNVPQPLYHFTKYDYGVAAAFSFNPLQPTSLLYKKTANGGYKLVGVMYTDSIEASEAELNERIPLSIARWHQHINFCRAPFGQEAAYFGPHPKFGLRGSITTEAACEAAGGEFHRHLFGWMVHVYPYETNPKNIWATNDDRGHDNMDRSAMPGMQMR